MNNRTAVLIVAAATLMMASCVPARKYQELQTAKQGIEKENAQLKKNNETLDAKQKELQSKLDLATKDNSKLAADTAQKGKEYRQLRSQYDKINELNDILSRKSNELLDQASGENRKLAGELDAARTELQKREDAVKFLEKSLNEKETNLNKATTDLQEREKKLQELESLMAEQQAASEALKKKISAALLGFADKGISVKQEGGKVYVNMEAKLLFASGSTKVEEAGKKAIIDLAKAIENEADMEIVVEGHTDTDKLASPNYPHDNWELSVLRATEVIKILTANSDLDPKVLSASGRSEYHPVNAADKAKNRRIEIILSPKLDELYQLIDND